jgi:hypothetical protein
MAGAITGHDIQLDACLCPILSGFSFALYPSSLEVSFRLFPLDEGLF